MSNYGMQIDNWHTPVPQVMKDHITTPRPPAPLHGEWRIRQLLVSDCIEECGIRIMRLANGIYGMMRHGVWYIAGSNYATIAYAVKLKQALMLFNDLANGCDCADNIAKMCPRCSRMPAFLTAHGIAMCEDCAYGGDDVDKSPCVYCGKDTGVRVKVCDTCYRRQRYSPEREKARKSKLAK